MSDPNTCIITNNSGSYIDAIVLMHSSGIPVVTGPADMVPVLLATGLSSGSQSQTAVAQVDILDDYWVLAMIFDGNQDNYIITSSDYVMPFKQCSSPRNGSTNFVINSTEDVTIETYESDGSSDGNCDAPIQPLSGFMEVWYGLMDIVSHTLQELMEEGGGDAVINKPA
jgi:hypothetical protein